MPEVAFLAPPLLSAGARVLPTPASYWVTGEDRLRLTSWTSIFGFTFALSWRLADPTGRIVANKVFHVPNSNRSIKQQDYDIGVGSLLNLTLDMAAGAPPMNTAFVRVQLVRGIDLAAVVLGTL